MRDICLTEDPTSGQLTLSAWHVSGGTVALACKVPGTEKMARFYKGVGVGTHLHGTDLRTTGIVARNPGATSSVSALMAHIAQGTTTSPFISLTRSYGVARDYAVNASRAMPTASIPAYVYEIDIDDTHNVSARDPIFEIARSVNNLFANISYQHNGDQSYLLGVVDPIGNRARLQAPPPQPKTMGGSSAPSPRLTTELEALVRGLRDAEVLIAGMVPQACVIHRYDEY